MCVYIYIYIMKIWRGIYVKLRVSPTLKGHSTGSRNTRIPGEPHTSKLCGGGA